MNTRATTSDVDVGGVRIAVLAPAIALAGASGDNFTATIAWLAKHCTIDVYTDASRWLPESLVSLCVIHSFDVYDDPQGASPADLAIYVMGDAPCFRPVYEQAIKRPGIVILQQSGLQVFFLSAYDSSHILDEVEYNHGLDTRQQVEAALGPGHTPESLGVAGIGLERRIVEQSLVTVVSDQPTRDALQKRHPHRTILALDLGSPEDAGALLLKLSIETIFGEADTAAAPISPRLRRASGVNFIGDLKTMTGLNEAATSMLNAMLRAEIPVAFTELPSNFDGLRSSASPRYDALPRGTPYRTNFLCYNLNQIAFLPYDQLHSLTGGRYTIGFWFWEMPEVPPMFWSAFDRVDEVWVSTRYIQTALQTVATRPITLMPLPVEVTTSPDVSRDRFGLPKDRFIFFFNFAASSLHSRKNPWGVIDAFEHAFGRGNEGGPLLALKAHYLERFPDVASTLEKAVARVGGVLLRENYSRQQMNDLLACADAYVSLHRAEGFGLGIAESMYLGKPVIGTAYSGNADFMSEDNSFPVPYHLRRITAYDHRFEESHAPFSTVYEIGQLWAEPDIEAAAAAMRLVYEQPAEAHRRGQQAARDIRRLHSPLAVGRAINARLAALEYGMAPGGSPAQTQRPQTTLPSATSWLGVGSPVREAAKRVPFFVTAVKGLRRLRSNG